MDMSAEFSTPKVVAGGKFLEFTEAPRHAKVFIAPDAILGVQENDKAGGSCLFLPSAPPVLVEQECIQIVAVLALRARKQAGDEMPDYSAFEDALAAVKWTVRPEGDVP